MKIKVVMNVLIMMAGLSIIRLAEPKRLNPPKKYLRGMDGDKTKRYKEYRTAKNVERPVF